MDKERREGEEKCVEEAGARDVDDSPGRRVDELESEWWCWDTRFWWLCFGSELPHGGVILPGLTVESARRITIGPVIGRS